MSDEVDVANDYAERELADRLYHRVQYQGESAPVCGVRCRDSAEAPGGGAGRAPVSGLPVDQ